MKGINFYEESEVMKFAIFRDGRFQIGDEIVNVNGVSMRRITMRD